MQEATLKAAVESPRGTRSQILYNVGLCLWQMTYDEASLAQMQKSRVVEPLVDLLKQGAEPSPCPCRVFTPTRHWLVKDSFLGMGASELQSGTPNCAALFSPTKAAPLFGLP